MVYPRLVFAYPAGYALFFFLSSYTTFEHSSLKSFINHDDGGSFFRFQPYVLIKEKKEERSVSPDAVFITPEQRKIFETATFQFRSKDVLEAIANSYLHDLRGGEPLEQNFDPANNLELQVSQRITKLVKTLLGV